MTVLKCLDRYDIEYFFSGQILDQMTKFSVQNLSIQAASIERTLYQLYA